MSERPDEFPDEDFFAADYALGTLSARERLRAERRLRGDDAFRRDVEAWEAHLMPLAAGYPAAEPPAALWSAIEAGLPALRETARAPAAPTRGEGLVPAFWRWLALGSGALAAASLAALAVFAVPAAGPAGDVLSLAASITSDDGLPIFAVVLDPGENTATLVPIRLDAGPGRQPELWLVREGETRPRSLGTFRADEPLRLSISGDTLRGNLSGGTLAISLEPEGGSPTGQPTGPVVGHGALREI